MTTIRRSTWPQGQHTRLLPYEAHTKRLVIRQAHAVGHEYGFLWRVLWHYHGNTDDADQPTPPIRQPYRGRRKETTR